MAARGTEGVARADGARAGWAGIFGTARALSLPSGAVFGTLTRGVRAGAAARARGGFAARVDAARGALGGAIGYFAPFFGAGLTGTPRFLSRALSRAEPGLIPARLSAAVSDFSVHFLPAIAQAFLALPLVVIFGVLSPPELDGSPLQPADEAVAEYCLLLVPLNGGGGPTFLV